MYPGFEDGDFGLLKFAGFGIAAPEGGMPITNNTKFHNFFNGGEQDRIHLVACVLEDPFN